VPKLDQEVPTDCPWVVIVYSKPPALLEVFCLCLVIPVAAYHPGFFMGQAWLDQIILHAERRWLRGRRWYSAIYNTALAESDVFGPGLRRVSTPHLTEDQVHLFGRFSPITVPRKRRLLLEKQAALCC